MATKKPAKKPWNICPYDPTWAKSFQITGPSSNDGGLVLNVDYDDVEHELVEQEAEKLVEILNKYWDE